MTKTERRRYSRESGIHTRLRNRRIMLHQDDIERLVVPVRQRQDKTDQWRTCPPVVLSTRGRSS
jgi:hypothetical protein